MRVCISINQRQQKSSGSRGSSPRTPGSTASSMSYGEGDDGDDDDHDGTHGGQGGQATSSTGSDALTASSNDLMTAMELLGEKRLARRETGLTSLVQLLRTTNRNNRACDILLRNHDEELGLYLQKTLRHPASEQEGRLCTQVIAVLGLWTGADDDDFVEQYDTLLRTLVRSIFSYTWNNSC
jgi:hypothetical protein